MIQRIGILVVDLHPEQLERLQLAREQERPLGALPDQVAVSVVTLSELRHGVLAAAGHEQMARRLSTLEAARQIAKPLVIDEAVGDELARLRVALKAIGRAMKVMASSSRPERNSGQLIFSTRP